MSKDTINVKSNGLRNELKEIKKSIDRLTNAMVQMIDIMAQTHKQDEKNYYTNGKPFVDGELWNTTSTSSSEKAKVS